MELAVNIPEQDPQDGQADVSSSPSSASVISPRLTLPTPSNTVIRSAVFPLWEPASMGPPLTMMAGTFSLSMAMSIPGTILSQLVTRTRASKGWPGWAG